MTSEDVRLAAYYKWLHAGCPDYRDVDFWLDAERELAHFQYQLHSDAVANADPQAIQELLSQIQEPSL